MTLKNTEYVSSGSEAINKNMNTLFGVKVWPVYFVETPEHTA